MEQLGYEAFIEQVINGKENQAKRESKRLRIEEGNDGWGDHFAYDPKLKDYIYKDEYGDVYTYSLTGSRMYFGGSFAPIYESSSLINPKPLKRWPKEEAHKKSIAEARAEREEENKTVAPGFKRPSNIAETGISTTNNLIPSPNPSAGIITAVPILIGAVGGGTSIKKQDLTKTSPDISAGAIRDGGSVIGDKVAEAKSEIIAMRDNGQISAKDADEHLSIIQKIKQSSTEARSKAFSYADKLNDFQDKNIGPNEKMAIDAIKFGTGLAFPNTAPKVWDTIDRGLDAIRSESIFNQNVTELIEDGLTGLAKKSNSNTIMTITNRGLDIAAGRFTTGDAVREINNSLNDAIKKGLSNNINGALGTIPQILLSGGMFAAQLAIQGDLQPGSISQFPQKEIEDAGLQILGTTVRHTIGKVTDLGAGTSLPQTVGRYARKVVLDSEMLKNPIMEKILSNL